MFSTTETEEERCMDSLPQIPERNYRQHTYETRLHCCKRVRESRWPIPKGAAYKIKCLFNKSKSNGMSSVEIWVKANAQTGLSMCYMTVLRQLKRLDGYAALQDEPQEALQEIPHAR